jgi:GNAT superfamily N-acetyltransferase
MNLDLIRPARSVDVKTVTRLVNRAYRPGIRSAAWTHESGIITGDRTDDGQVASKIHQPGSVVLVGLAGNALVACVHVSKQMETSHFGMLAVDPSLQAVGRGKQILAFAEEFASINFNAERFAVTVISTRIELVAFYLRRGYQKTGGPKPYPLAAGAGTPVQPDLTVERLEKPNVMHVSDHPILLIPK